MYYEQLHTRATVKGNAMQTIIRVHKMVDRDDNYVALRLSGEAPREIYGAISSQAYIFVLSTYFMCWKHITKVNNFTIDLTIDATARNSRRFSIGYVTFTAPDTAKFSKYRR